MRQHTLHYLFIAYVIFASQNHLFAMENNEIVQVTPVTDAQKLSDVYKHRTKSVYYDPNHVRGEFSNPIYMIKSLVDALKHHNLNSCLGLLAKDVPLSYPLVDLNCIFFEAIDADYAPFCQFLLDEKFYSLDTLDPNLRLPLERALRNRSADVAKLFIERGALIKLKKTKPGERLLNYPLTGLKSYDTELERIEQVFQVLTMHGERFNEPINFSSRRYYFADTIPCNPDDQRLQSLLPALMKHGMQPELCNHNGEPLLYRIKERYLSHIFLYTEQARDKFVKTFAELMCLIAFHHERAQEQQGIYTLLAIHKLRKDSLIAKLPKDVVHSILIPMMGTFKLETVSRCAQKQCSYLLRLLFIKPLPTFKQDDSDDIKQQTDAAILSLLDPSNVNQHYEECKRLTFLYIAQKKAIRNSKNKVS